MTEPQDFIELKTRLFEIARQTTDPFKAQWDARKDVAKTLISLSSGALVFTITFASSLIKPNTSGSLRCAIDACWLAFISSLILALLSLWFSIGLHNFEALLVTKNEQINQVAADNRELLPSLVADTWQEIVREDKKVSQVINGGPGFLWHCPAHLQYHRNSSTHRVIQTRHNKGMQRTRN